MDNAIIDKIKALFALDPPTESPKSIPAPDGDGLLCAVRTGYEVKEFVGPKKDQRVHKFHDLGSFADWLKRHASDRAKTVEILAGETSVDAALSPFDVYGDFLTCELRYHPAFVAWKEILGKKLGQKAFFQHVRGHLENFQDLAGGPNYGELLATELQKMVRLKGADMETSVDQFGTLTFTSHSATVQLTGQIKPNFSVYVPIFMGVCEPPKIAAAPGTVVPPTLPANERIYELEMLLSIDIEPDVSFTITCPALAVEIHEARLHAVEWLKYLLSQGGAEFMVGLGVLTFKEVPDIKKVATS